MQQSQRSWPGRYARVGAEIVADAKSDTKTGVILFAVLAGSLVLGWIVVEKLRAWYWGGV